MSVLILVLGIVLIFYGMFLIWSTPVTLIIAGLIVVGISMGMM